MSTWYTKVEMTVSTTYTKIVKIERPPLWEPNDLGKPLEGEDQLDVNNRVFSDEEVSKLFRQEDLKVYKQTQEIDYQVLAISQEESSLV